MSPPPSTCTLRPRLGTAWLLPLIGAVLWLLTGGVLTGCTTIPKGRSSIDAVIIRGASQVSDSDLEDSLATAETEKFLGLFRGIIFDYELFDRFVLQRDLARVERFYRARGFYDAHARAGRIHRKSDNHVEVEIVVEEGKPIEVHDITFLGIDNLPARIKRAVDRATKTNLAKGSPFDEAKYAEAENDVRRALTDRGYAYAEVDRDASLDLVTHQAHVTFKIAPGKAVHFGKTTFEGLGELPEDRVRRTFDIEAGETYSTKELDAAQAALLDLQVFSSVEITPDLSNPQADEVPLKVTTEVSKLKTLKLGVGLEFDVSRADIHFLAGWENHNFFGGLRTFSVKFQPGLVFYPLRFDNIVKPTQVLPMEKLRFELRQPGVLEARTAGFVRPEFNVIPFLPPNPPPGAPVIGYGEIKNAVGLDRTLWKIYGAIIYNIGVAYPFGYVGELDGTLRTLVISNPEIILNLDLRNDRLHPHKGFYLGNDIQVAGGPFGGNATDIRYQPEARGYIPLGKKVTLALRLGLGFLFPLNYGDVIENELGDPGPDPRTATPALKDSFDKERLAYLAGRTRDFQIMYFRGLFSGGPNSNRGYPLRSIGPHAFVPFLNPQLAAAQQANRCQPGDTSDPKCAATVGGMTLWETSIELRVPISGPLSTAFFCDASDVSNKQMDFRLDRPHLSCGLGGRYDTPVGPIRLDIGYRIDGLQVLRKLDQVEQFEEGDPGKLFGLPLGIAFGVGEAF